VGGFLFTVPEARNSDEYLQDAQAFPASELLHYREVVEGEFQDITKRSFTTRVVYRDFTADGSGEQLMLLPDAQAIEQAWVNDVEITDLTGWTISPMGKVTYPAATYPYATLVTTDPSVLDGDAVRLRVRYGFAVVPPKVKEVGMIRLRSLMAATNSGIPDRATTWQPEQGGTFRLATPGMGKSETGIPEVDAALKRYTLDTLLGVYGVG
jgi:hypothetical protein